MSLPVALDELRSCAGTQLDPRVVEVLSAVIEDGGRERSPGAKEAAR